MGHSVDMWMRNSQSWCRRLSRINATNVSSLSSSSLLWWWWWWWWSDGSKNLPTQLAHLLYYYFSSANITSSNPQSSFTSIWWLMEIMKTWTFLLQHIFTMGNSADKIICW